MSAFAYLLCPEKKMMLGFGKPLREALPDGTIHTFAYHIGPETEPKNSERIDLTKALWKFLAETRGCALIVKTEYEMTDEENAFVEIGGDVPPKDISFEDYLRDWKW
jgi:hypothetical protein